MATKKTTVKKTTAKKTAAKKANPLTAPKAVSYKPPAYNEAKYRKGINTSYYTNAIKTFTNQANKQRANQIAQAGQAKDSALKSAYIQRAQNERSLADNMAAAGIRGGASETANLGLQNQYGQAVSSANSDYANSVNSINQSVDQSIADYSSDMNSRAEEYRQNLAQSRWQADREAAQARYDTAVNRQNAIWQARREDDLNNYNKRQEYWNNYYLDYYSGVGKKTLDKALKQAKAEYKKAKTTAEKQRIQQKIRGIQNRRGVLANAK